MKIAVREVGRRGRPGIHAGGPSTEVKKVMAEFQDKVITCVDCGQSFVHSAGAQEFYSQKGFTSDPKRCPDCRRAKKDKQPGGGGGSYGGGSRSRSSTSDNDALFGGGRSSSSSSSSSGGGGGDRGGGGGYGGGAPREMFSATCAECGVETQVPFKPRGDRPVYCR